MVSKAEANRTGYVETDKVLFGARFYPLVRYDIPALDQKLTQAKIRQFILDCAAAINPPLYQSLRLQKPQSVGGEALTKVLVAIQQRWEKPQHRQNFATGRLTVMSLVEAAIVNSLHIRGLEHELLALLDEHYPV